MHSPDRKLHAYQMSEMTNKHILAGASAGKFSMDFVRLFPTCLKQATELICTHVCEVSVIKTDILKFDFKIYACKG